MRSVGGGVDAQSTSRARPANSAIRNPHSAIVVLLAACTPITSRPAFLPYPQAPVGIIEAPAPRIVPEAMGWLANEGLRVEWSSPQDGYVETAWFNVRTRNSMTGQGDPGALLDTIKLRCWVDPNAPGKSQLTVEAVYRPILDPSRSERDLEVIVPQGSEGHRIAVQLIEAMKQKFGS
ncbi:MAG: hypothetical protein ACREMW_09120 [Gemmatimonadales bacterium]